MAMAFIDAIIRDSVDLIGDSFMSGKSTTRALRSAFTRYFTLYFLCQYDVFDAFMDSNRCFAGVDRGMVVTWLDDNTCFSFVGQAIGLVWPITQKVFTEALMRYDIYTAKNMLILTRYISKTIIIAILLVALVLMGLEILFSFIGE